MQTISWRENSASIEYPGGIAKLRRCGTALSVFLDYGGAYGMGEKFDCLDHKGRRVVNRVEEKFCFQGEKTYCPAPFFWTDTGFGLYVNTDEETAFEFAEGEIHVELPERADITVFSGSPETMIRQYMGLFGKAALPPEWAFGVWISANRWSSQRDALEAAEKLKEHGFPASVLVLEAWSDEATFYIFNGAKYTPRSDGSAFRYEDFNFSLSPWPDPKAMLAKLKSQGLHTVLWQIPVYKHIPSEEPDNEQNRLDSEYAVRSGLCVMSRGGSPYIIPAGHWFSGSMLPDFTNSQTRESWFAKRQYLLDIGVDGFKTDGGEFIYGDEAVFSDGSDGRSGKNRYARDYTEAYRDFIGGSRVLFSRAGYAGQHSVPIHWTGDQQSQNCELKSALTAGLSASLTGIIFWGFDIGGFAGALPSIDLYRRATQLACFCPIMQWHSEPDGGQFREQMKGAEGNNERSPWNIAEAYGCPEFIEEMRFWHLLREKLRPYLWDTAQKCVEQSRPMTRPLVYLWPEDRRAAACDDEFMLGDALLVAPLLEENQCSRTVYLPQGEWTEYFTGERCTGGQEVTAGGNGRLPVFVRVGAEFN